MFIIDCPWCGKRDQSEFTANGEAHIERPQNPATLSDVEWANYLFFRNNPKGLHFERWNHTHGCRRWFNIARNTATNEIYGSYKPGEQAPTETTA
jgi:heterotetrameric sarcosine oxidase delta subunit